MNRLKTLRTGKRKILLMLASLKEKEEKKGEVFISLVIGLSNVYF
jgi:hypothetical protein